MYVPHLSNIQALMIDYNMMLKGEKINSTMNINVDIYITKIAMLDMLSNLLVLFFILYKATHLINNADANATTIVVPNTIFIITFLPFLRLILNCKPKTHIP